MKRFRLFLICIICFVTVCIFCTCCKKSSEKQNENTDVKNFTFELICYSVTKKCNLENPQKYYYPALFKKYFELWYWENGNKSPFVEKYYPDKLGVIEGLSFYNPAEDTGDWIENLVLITEEQRIGDELLEMEENFSEALLEPVETEIIELGGKNNQLKIMEYGNEILMPYSTDEFFVTIESDEKLITRKFFDKKYRLVKCENWNIMSVDNAKLVSTEEYLFTQDNFRPYQKTITAESEYTQISYNDKGLAEESKKYTVDGEKRTLKSVSEWTYNENLNLTCEINTEYYYNKNNKVDYTFEKKYTYIYNKSEEENEADKLVRKEYFENDVLKMREKYSQNLGTYTRHVYFDDNYSVESYYENYKRIKDLYIRNEEIERIKTYE